MKEKVCCFTGHRDIDIYEIEEIKNRLYSEIENLINIGIIYFGTGGARGFDTLAAEAILDLRKKYSQIRLILVLPCMNQTKNWSLQDKEKYVNIKKKADKVRILSADYYDGCMQVRNRYLVDNSVYMICYKRRNNGGTAYTVNYAKTKDVIIIEI